MKEGVKTIVLNCCLFYKNRADLLVKLRIRVVLKNFHVKLIMPFTENILCLTVAPPAYHKVVLNNSTLKHSFAFL